MTLFHQAEKHRLLVGLLNMQEQVPTIPVGGTVRVHVPAERRARRVLHLPDQKEIPFEKVGPYVQFHVAPFKILTMALKESHFIDQVWETGRKYNTKFMMTHNGGEAYPLDAYVAAEFDPYGVDFYSPSSSAKTVRARAKGKEVELIGHRFNQLWDFTCKPHTQMRFETATAIAHNCAMMYVDQPNLDGTFDPQVYATLKKGFVAADDLVPHVKGTVPYAEVALLSAEGSFFFGRATGRNFAGAYEMLTELHWPFDVVTEEALNESDLAKFRVLVVPNSVQMSAAQAVVPVHGLAVKLRGRQVREAYNLKGVRLKTETQGEMTSIAVPVVEQYEGIRIRMT